MIVNFWTQLVDRTHNEGKTDFRLRRVCFNIKHTSTELREQSEPDWFPSDVQTRVVSTQRRVQPTPVSLHGVNFHTQAKKIQAHCPHWDKQQGSHLICTEHTHTHTLSRSKAEWSWVSQWSGQTSLFVSGSEFIRTASVLHSHCFGLEVFHESIFACGWDREHNTGLLKERWSCQRRNCQLFWKMCPLTTGYRHV